MRTLRMEQIRKHGEVIQWWLSNPEEGVYCRYNNHNEWFNTIEPTWNEYYIYVQNDEYVEFRKALADGKQIQFLQTVNDAEKNPKWIDCPNGFKFTKDITYRIKPEFEVGCWIYIPSGDPEGKALANIIYAENGKYKAECNKYTSWCTVMWDDESLENGKVVIEKWSPERGEWCVFYNELNCSEYIIAKYKESDNKFYTEDLIGYKHIAPLEFIQKLKEER